MKSINWHIQRFKNKIFQERSFASDNIFEKTDEKNFTDTYNIGIIWSGP